MAAKPNTALYEDLEKRVRSSLASQDQTKLRVLLVKEHPANIAGVMDRLNHLQRHGLFDMLSIEKKAKVLDEMSITATRQVLDRLSPKEIGTLLDLMPMDEAAEIIYQDAPNRKDELLAAMSPKQAAEVQRLLEYPPESAGRMLTEKFARLKRR
jgi:magnesium transporter